MSDTIKYNPKKDSYQFNEKSIDFFINVGFEVTRRCNLACIHCCESDLLVPDNSLKNIKIMIDKLVSGGLKKICVTGGEALLRQDLADILKYMHNKKIRVLLSTNGTLLTKKKLLSFAPYIDNIRFSLHGLEKTHDEITRQKGSFNKVIEAITMAVDLNMPVSIVNPVISKNYPEMIDVARLCEKNRVEKLYYFSLISRGRGNTLYNKENVSFRKIKTRFKDILSIIKTESWNLQLSIADWTINGQCALIFPNGTLVAVPSLKDKDHIKIVGNILTEDARQLWIKYPFKENYINYYKYH